jgi:site-specific DNA recombinase
MQNDLNQQPIQYCLYARKSSEDDERQAMSIESQVKEMGALAATEGLIVKEIRRESHSAKQSGQRPVFNSLLRDLREGIFDGILTWAPDRLSRNAGDLGMLVDLMDQSKLLRIRAFSQTFSNNPNEKFLLMILCSQAKLENDQKGINVKRGIRAKCEMGWRPSMPPLGYYSRAMAGLKDTVIDPERAQFVVEMFERVSERGDSGRAIKKWFDSSGMTTRTGKKVKLSQIYKMLKNTYYYGDFEFPVGSGTWYKGKHKPLVSKETFDEVQKQLIIPFKKAKWGSKRFTFKGLFLCAFCGGSIIGEDKYRKRKTQDSVYHIYYHCSKRKDENCQEPYLTEEKLIKSLNQYVHFLFMIQPQNIKYTEKLKMSIDKYKEVRGTILLTQDINPDDKKIDFRDYAKHIFKSGTTDEKREIVKAISGSKMLFIHNEGITSNRH